MRPIKGISEVEVGKEFFKELLFNYSQPKEQIEENGGCFLAKIMRSVCKILNFYDHFMTEYHLRGNGRIERFSRTIRAMTHSYLTDHSRHCDLYTAAFNIFQNYQPHTTTAVPQSEPRLPRPLPSLAVREPHNNAETSTEARSSYKERVSKKLSESRGKVE